MTLSLSIINIYIYIEQLHNTKAPFSEYTLIGQDRDQYHIYLVRLYIIRCLLLKYRLIFLRGLKVFDEPLGESNTERRIKISAGISKEGT